jgi:DNA-binding response OmpR family regulator
METAWKILAIDDDPEILIFLTLILQADGYEVTTAVSGAETISCVNEFLPDLILLDMKFPPCSENHQSTLEDGLLIFSWLRGMSRAAKTPVIIISGADPEEYRERAQAMGAVATIQKPIDTKQLLQVISTTLAGHCQPQKKSVESYPCW